MSGAICVKDRHLSLIHFYMCYLVVACEFVLLVMITLLVISGKGSIYTVRKFFSSCSYDDIICNFRESVENDFAY